MPDWPLLLPWDLISSTAADFKLDRKFVGAIIWHESAGIPSATRFEPNYRYLYFVDRYAENLSITTFTEENAQKTSYGLVQIMGAVARELGYSDYLSRLVEPKLNLEFGCRKLLELKVHFGGDLSKMASAYNGGLGAILSSGFTNEKYVDAVMGLYRALQT